MSQTGRACQILAPIIVVGWLEYKSIHWRIRWTVTPLQDTLCFISCRKKEAAHHSTSTKCSHAFYNYKSALMVWTKNSYWILCWNSIGPLNWDFKLPAFLFRQKKRRPRHYFAGEPLLLPCLIVTDSFYSHNQIDDGCRLSANSGSAVEAESGNHCRRVWWELELDTIARWFVNVSE